MIREMIALRAVAKAALDYIENDGSLGLYHAGKSMSARSRLIRGLDQLNADKETRLGNDPNLTLLAIKWLRSEGLEFGGAPCARVTTLLELLQKVSRLGHDREAELSRLVG